MGIQLLSISVECLKACFLGELMGMRIARRGRVEWGFLIQRTERIIDSLKYRHLTVEATDTNLEQMGVGQVLFDSYFEINDT